MNRPLNPLPCQTHDPEIWFPVGSSGAATAQAELAASYCQGCPIKAACLQRALDLNAVDGIWGGTNPYQRANIIRRRERAMDSEEARLTVARALASA